MLEFKPFGWTMLLVWLVCMAVLGCNAKPYDYQPTAGEMKPGPGVLTGEDGELTIYDSKKDGALPTDSDAQAAETSEKTAAQTTAAAGTAAAGSPEKACEFQEFQEYQQWQQTAQGSSDFQEFQAYQEWKKSGKQSADYKEFQEWREFKAYQEWKKSQKK